MPTSIASFGFNKGVPEDAGIGEAALIIDVRREGFTRNPFANKALRHLRGTDDAIQADIQRTPGFDYYYRLLYAKVSAHAGAVYLGCTGGHHRSVYLAERLAKELDIPVVHYHIDQ